MSQSARKLPTVIVNVVHDKLSQSLEILGDVLVGENFGNEQLKRLKEQKARLLEAVNS